MCIKNWNDIFRQIKESIKDIIIDITDLQGDPNESAYIKESELVFDVFEGHLQTAALSDHFLAHGFHFVCRDFAIDNLPNEMKEVDQIEKINTLVICGTFKVAESTHSLRRVLLAFPATLPTKIVQNMSEIGLILVAKATSCFADLLFIRHIYMDNI